ncbi:FadR/GntR family transcriptional regulator [Nonomuraea sp. CA-141351]|uniref:FadR/GntR family transcriptional regulator n=1 Tax=Nonomuraea sp. CA-141351 TaxID=3239996 RepID=UPI003D8BABEF
MSSEQTRVPVRYEPLARTPLPDVIAEQLLAEIDSGALRPGDRLPSEPELARQLQVGRSSLREAIRKLHTLGVVEVVRGRGTYVRHRTEPEPTPQFVHWSATQGPAIAEVLEVRIGLELAASGLACVRATQTDIDEVAARCREHEAARRKGDLAVLVRTDEQVHESLIRAAHNDLLLQVYLALVPQMAEFRAHTLALQHADERFDPHHQAMLAALVKRDAAGVRKAVVQHVAALYGEVKAAGTVETGRRSAGQMLDFATILANFT